MPKLKDQLTSEVVGIILLHVRNKKGRLTKISDDSKINRKEFNSSGLAKMKFHRVIRLLYAIAFELTYAEYKQMMNEIRDTITEWSDKYDYTLLDE